MSEIEELGIVIRRLRNELGLSQEAMGASIGMSQAQIILVEKNGVDSLALLQCFAEFFGTDVVELLEMCRQRQETD